MLIFDYLFCQANDKIKLPENFYHQFSKVSRSLIFSNKTIKYHLPYRQNRAIIELIRNRMDMIKAVYLCLFMFIFTIQATAFGDEIQQTTSTIKGQVISKADGLGIKGVKIVLIGPHDITYNSVTAKDGDFIITDIKSGGYFIYYSPPYTYACENIEQFPSKLDTIIIGEPKTYELIKELGFGGILELQAIDSQKKQPLSGIGVTIPQAYKIMPLKPETNQKGLFVLYRLSAGSYNIYASRKNYGTQKYYVSIEPQVTTRVMVDYHPNNLTSLNGTVKCQAEKAPSSKYLLHITQVEDSYHKTVCSVNNQGAFKCFQMQAGNYRVSLFLKSAIDNSADFQPAAIAEKEITIIHNQQHELNFLIDCP
jgi:hypothetical protein